MPLSWNEIRDRALSFSREWKDAESEQAESQSFWNDFFRVFGIDRRRVAVFEKQVSLTRAGERLKHGRIDAFWKGVLLVEHKSAGQDLDKAFAQAADYFEGIAERDLPRYILVSDFRRFRLFDLESGEDWSFRLADLHKHVRRFGFVAGYRTQEIREQDPVNVEAAERMGRLHDRLKATGYAGHPLEVLLVRLLFCLFADDTGIFPKQSFREFIETKTSEDGADLGLHLAQLFQVLNTEDSQRQSTLDEALAAFPYVNGKLFEEPLPLATFDSRMRTTLLDCAGLDWSRISPAVFGALFQSVMDEKARRNLGAHYTSEKNILKLIKPLFLDGLWDEFNKVKGNLTRLFEFHKRLRTLTFLDPACGCGNFLVIAYRELRLLELEILRTVLKMERGQQHLNVFQLVQVNVDQFHGIEIEEFPAQIAQVAMWLIDHQMNQLVSEEFGNYYARLPLTTSAHIVHGNALRMDWNEVVPAARLNWILGNPPFVGHQWRNPEQMQDMDRIWGTEGRFGRLDYVTCWHRKAAELIQSNHTLEAAFVSTNSITQGEQVSILWPDLLARGIRITFAHRTFQWTNEARGEAAVHCVIVGLGTRPPTKRRLFDYSAPRSEPHETLVDNINPYLVPGPDVILPSRTDPAPDIPQMKKGSQPTDGGFLVLSDEARSALLASEPQAAPWIREYVGGDELISRDRRWCLWLKGIQPAVLKTMPHVLERVESVRAARLKSPTKSVRDYAQYPTLFTQDRQPETEYLAVPEVSSENRRFIPMAFLPSTVVASNKLQMIVGATRFHFGVLNSTMHMAWVRAVTGRLESRLSYAPSVYNNFPWPRDLDLKYRKQIEQAAQGVLDARSGFPNASLAELYDPLTMPPELARAHQVLDRAVDAAYLAGRSRKGFASDAERVAFLFELYQEYTSLLPAETKPKRGGRRNRRP
ncbi:MAG: class I SAM-dependent DNA methyltransferase [Burkholderiales bacterium]